MKVGGHIYSVNLWLPVKWDINSYDNKVIILIFYDVIYDTFINFF